MSKIISEITVQTTRKCSSAKFMFTRTLFTSTSNKADTIPESTPKDNVKKVVSIVREAENVKEENNYDVVIVGGGIVGVATAREMSNRSCSLKMALLEKEDQLAYHQTGHNSGIIHAGIYYKPGSLKAKLCVEGLQLSYDYFDCKKIPYRKCGKLIVATNAAEVCQLDDIHQKGIQNKVPGLTRLKCLEDIKKIEPLCAGIEALWSPETGIVDWSLVTKHLAEDFKTRKGKIHLGFQVDGFCGSGNKEYPVRITSTCDKSINAKYVLTCGGLQSDRLAIMSGCSKHPKIIPFRGEYLELKPEKACQFKTNIYPVPDPRFPFLGIHLTPRMDGSVWLGPNAVLAFKREGYKFMDWSFKELSETLFYPGFIRMAIKYLKPGTIEMIKSRFTGMIVKDVQKLIPSITTKDISKANVLRPAGVRAQAMDSKGNLIDDFVFDINESGSISSRILHCRNAPSPAATSSMAIAKYVADRCAKQFKLAEIDSVTPK